MMTREEAIDILFGVIQANSEEENEALDMAIEVLDQTQWIPCSVEMPISDGIYIVDDRRFGKSWIHTVGYVKKSNSWCELHGVYYDDKCGRYRDQDKIVAWAYLPQPWKGEKK